MSYRHLKFYTIKKRSFYSACWPAVLVYLVVSGCASTQKGPVPVVDRFPEEPGKTVERPDPSGPVPDTTVQRGRPYVVQKGDTLYAIALNQGVSQKDLAEWNNIQDPGS